VKSYYESIDHDVLMDQLKQVIPDPLVLRLLRGYLQHLEDDGGILRPVNRGISLGCPLSPLMSALYLKPLDQAMEKTGLFYARFMDDWVVLSPTRWKLRKAIKVANQVLERLKVEKHPDKTFVGRIDRGFDFMGYHYTSRSHRGLEVASKTIENYVARIARLYEQGASLERIGTYIRNWWRWANSGVYLKHINPCQPSLIPTSIHCKSLRPYLSRITGNVKC
jgi:hypothetical protein